MYANLQLTFFLKPYSKHIFCSFCFILICLTANYIDHHFNILQTLCKGIGISYLDCDYRIRIAFRDAPWLFLTLYIVYISVYVIWTDMSENKLFVIVIVIVITYSIKQAALVYKNSISLWFRKT